ncbi:MAG: hypothetical protein JAY99_12365 [Candidatus Thiodiazotropha lotti]|nr:hypothetical protein [Candidatus Thiodiazotropha lotti]MCG8000316.1 hypothetical protein [Candidatus Thiodiazotropha lotti]MCW4184024.1 hypothetical protein [Candidatus Thiodiazotropha weberae]MCW4192086.1 hypothetical protein [Candidatus Thiodiazotropha weberae]
MPKTNSANQYASLRLPRQGFVEPDVGNGADCGGVEVKFSALLAPRQPDSGCMARLQRVNSTPKLLDVGEMGGYSSYT